MQKENLLRALRDLAELYQTGGLTREEFESTKQLLLAQMRRANEKPSRPTGSHPAGPHVSESSGSRAGGLRSSQPSRTSPSQPSRTGHPPMGYESESSPSGYARRDPPTRPAPSSQPSHPGHAPPTQPAPTRGNFEALNSLLSDLHQMQREGALDSNTLQAGQQYLLDHLQVAGTEPAANSPAMLNSTPHITPGPPVNQTISPGQTLLGRYYLERLLGQGGMGQVFLCYDTVREGHYALKVIHPHLAQFEDLRQRFLQELKVTERLTHPGIVRTYTLEQDTQSGFLFFTMEYCKGVTLESLLRQAEEAGRVPPLPLPVLLPALDELVQILEYAHSKGVIHRDLKPSNIMVGEGYRIKLMDFGIAKVLEGTAVSKHTGFGGFVYYMAPEQLRGGGVVSAASDVFSLGVISYQLLTGEIPMGHVEPPSLLWPRLPIEVDKVILKAMSPRSHQRYATPRQYWDALLQALSPLLNNIALPSHSARPTRPVSLDEVLEELQQSNPQEAVELSAHSADIPSQLAHQLLQDLSEVEPRAPLPPPRGPERVPKSPSSASQPGLYRRSGSPLPALPPLADGEDDLSAGPQVYPELDEASLDELDIFHSLDAGLPVGNLSASMELSIASTGPEISAPPILTKLQSTALELPPLPEGLEEEIFYAKDDSPLFRMVRIPEGAFRMGSEPEQELAYDNEIPQRTVHLDEYWIARTPLTHRVWHKFLEESQAHIEPPSEGHHFLQMWSGNAPPDGLLEHPIVGVGVGALQLFCEFYGLSLPTEAQWEKAARGEEGFLWPWGNTPPTLELCNFRDANIGHTTPVHHYPDGSSPYGLLDCSGNAWEWCSDHWNLHWLKEMGDDSKNPHYFAPDSHALGVSGGRIHHAIRGGCYRYHARGVRCAFRFSASAPAPYIGARVVRKAQSS